ncbi:T9SS type A sorting domain-containing protein [Siphonobacter sp. SORGH_AS_1065]|uniref:T9SS type A sorting domain-containing protein n=1 Tax=Siphonobacter sp. SORGH_AS_1065 TaxID=3041795 RepID=UPI002789CA72|nr:T9SS type A sorting domain-containing protein [Siphonobacter sp. SORGH_AS_1065]MDQ1086784.1 hypothetical protein [Siphonobacter sp. SORGH_AS_1065]
MKKILPALSFLLLTVLTFGLVLKSNAQSQHVGWIVYDQLPKNYQLYARGNDNMAQVPITGRTADWKNWNYVSVVTYRNGQPFSYHRSSFKPLTSTQASFEMYPTIKAEKADYSFDIYCCTATDSVHLTHCQDIVAGDIYAIYGQSNANAIMSSPVGDKYIRTFSRTPDFTNPGVSDADTNWINAAWTVSPVGYWGLELQNQILQKYGIPTCVINGAFPGRSIDELTYFQGQPSNFYKHLKLRISKSHASRIRAFFFYHGENDAFTHTPNYPELFDKLQKLWEKDYYPVVDEFVIMQMDVPFITSNTGSAIRESQRTVSALYPKMNSFATVGQPGYDGVHYSSLGYGTLATRLVNYLSPKHYGVPQTAGLRAPDIQKVYYEDEAATQLALQFDQPVQLPADSVIGFYLLSFRNFLYINGNESSVLPISSATAQGNTVHLKLSRSVSLNSLTYLPSHSANLPISPFIGPYIKNSRGLAAFTFHRFPVGNALSTPTLEARLQNGIVVLSWPAISGAEAYILERRLSGSDSFEYLATVEKNQFRDLTFEPQQAYTYRLKAVTRLSESAYAQASVQTSSISEEYLSQSLTLGPNPVSDRLFVNFGPTLTGTLQVYTLQGSLVHQQHFSEQKTDELNLSLLQPGTYILSVLTPEGIKVSKRFMKF